jgi:hypothetical protein
LIRLGDEYPGFHASMFPFPAFAIPAISNLPSSPVITLRIGGFPSTSNPTSACPTGFRSRIHNRPANRKLLPASLHRYFHPRILFLRRNLLLRSDHVIV